MIHAAVPLGIVPAGTGNVLATELGLRGRTEVIIRQVGEWIPRRLSAGLLTAGGGVSQRHFLMLAGVGFDAPIIRKVDPALKKSYGTLSYWIAGLGELNRELEEFEVRQGGATHRCSFVLASRVRNYGGTVEIARHAGLFREDFGVVLFEGRNTYQYLEYLAGAFANRLDGMRGASILHAQTLEFSPCWRRTGLRGSGRGTRRAIAGEDRNRTRRPNAAGAARFSRVKGKTGKTGQPEPRQFRPRPTTGRSLSIGADKSSAVRWHGDRQIDVSRPTGTLARRGTVREAVSSGDCLPMPGDNSPSPEHQGSLSRRPVLS